MKTENYFLALNQADSLEMSFNVFAQYGRSIGFECMAYSMLSAHKTSKSPRNVIFSNFPDNWSKRYSQQNYLYYDPIFVKAMSTNVPFCWHELKNETLSDYQQKILSEAFEFGLVDGIALGSHFFKDQVCCISVGTDKPTEFNKSQQLAQFLYFSVLLHEKVSAFIATQVNYQLTIKEQDVLLWAVEGLTDNEIADKLIISVNTVRYHWKNIFSKLGVKNKVHAVAKALLSGVIHPQKIN